MVVTTSSLIAPPAGTLLSDRLIRVANAYRDIPRITGGQQEVFRALWSSQMPLVVGGVEKRLKAFWSPQDLTLSYGTQKVLMISSVEECPIEVTAETFFNEFVRDDAERGSVIKLKVKLISLTLSEVSC